MPPPPAPMRIRPRPSRLLAGFVLTTHGAALAAILAVPLEIPWRIGILLAITTSLAYQLATAVTLRAPWAIREAVWGAQGWVLISTSGREDEARLLPSTLVARHLIVLNWRYGRLGSRSMVLLPDSLDAEAHRRLRVRLRLTHHTADREPEDAAAGPKAKAQSNGRKVECPPVH